MSNMRSLRLLYRQIPLFIIGIIYLLYALSPMAQATESTTPRMSPLQNKGVYTVGYTADHLPFSYIDDEGNLTGMGIAVMDYIAQTAGITVEYISIEEAVATNTKIDISLSILADDQLAQNSIASAPYTQLQMMAMGFSDTLDLKNARVGYLNYASITDEMVEEQLPGSIVTSYANYYGMVEDFSNGTLDYLLITNLVANQTNGLQANVDQVSLYTTDLSVDLQMLFHEDMSQGEIDAFDEILGDLEQEYVYGLMLLSATTAMDPALSAWSYFQSHMINILIALLVMILIGVLIIIRITHSRRKILETALNVDNVTGLMTERRFIEAATERIATGQPGEFTVIAVDIDNFKAINEIFGYQVGTQVIQLFAKKIQEVSVHTVLMGRSFADNFLLLLHGPVDDTNVESYRNSFDEKMSSQFTELLGADYRLMTSIGLYVVEDPTLPMPYMIDCANIARRRSKNIYGRTHSFFNSDIQGELRQKNAVTSTMEAAMENQEFKVHYQPKIHFQTKEIVGAEALVRWYKPDGLLIPPDSFIPIFEENGFVSRLDYYVIDKVCAFCRQNPALPKVSVNLSGYTLLDQNLVPEILNILKRHNLAPNRLEIEITESAIIHDFHIVARQTEALRKEGFTISMDDFGAGLSCLNRLKDMEIDVLKIDKVFLGTQEITHRGTSILDSIIQMSHSLGITTVAEGVETQEQERLLTDLQCDIAQGYYYARPLPESTYLDFVQTYTKE
ncbi:MAG: EAL domain-containing protein [Eubacteriales bacterium]